MKEKNFVVLLIVVSVASTTAAHKLHHHNHKKNFTTDFNGAPPPPGAGADLGPDESVMDHIMKVNLRKADGHDAPHMYTDDGSYVELFEGDIIKTPRLEDEVAEMKDGSQGGLRANDAINRGQWTDGEIPYTFHSYFSSAGRSVVRKAIEVFKKHTCIKFRPRSGSDHNYVTFMHGGGCSSMIGMQGGRQQISLANGCLVTGIAVHEMMHAAGFYHEQSRRDRDQYIRINWSNINRPMWYNFQKYQSGQASTLGEAYDKKSVMHYGNYAFSINGRKTIQSLSNYNEVLGQRSGFSKIDIAQLNKYYNCKNTGGGGVVGWWWWWWWWWWWIRLQRQLRILLPVTEILQEFLGENQLPKNVLRRQI
ncbi:hatching enzyme 1.2-like [Clytia hemisphaerica]|uniref:Metalloendopeptidase n=1 Tax=Clytia hemisphaerica TaxID=252671 RepID=A0A7M5X546_9CNID